MPEQKLATEIRKLPPMLPIREAAQMLGVHYRTMRRYCITGRIRHKRLAKKGRVKILIETRSLMDFLGFPTRMED